MYKVLGVGYTNVFRHIKKSMYLFDFIPCTESTL